ncbi:MAG: photosystem reaction center protein H, partial [Burkholderiales bacterium 12-64-5]
GFVGIGRHSVAIPMSQIEAQGDRIILAGATKENVKAMPEFVYATDSARRDRFLATADRDIASAKDTIAGYEKKAAGATADIKVRLDKQNVALRDELKVAEDKLGEMRKAGEKKWKQFEADVSRKMAHLRQSLEKSTG